MCTGKRKRDDDEVTEKDRAAEMTIVHVGAPRRFSSSSSSSSSYDPTTPPSPMKLLHDTTSVDSSSISSSKHNILPADGGSTQKQWSSSDFWVCNAVGEGKFGAVVHAVYRGSCNNTVPCNSNVALKCFDKLELLCGGRSSNSLELLRREVLIQRRLKHANILPLLGCYEDPTQVTLVLEFAPDGDLMMFIQQQQQQTQIFRRGANKEQRRLNQARGILFQLCQALEYLDAAHVAHRDIKPENVLCFFGKKKQQDNIITVKLCDFGWAIQWKPGQRRTTLCGTAEFCPPEMLQSEISYEAEYCDRWMLGVLAIELVHSTTPFCPSETELFELDDVEIKEKIFDKIRTFVGITIKDDDDDKMKKKNDADPDFRDLVSSLLQVDPSDRLSAGNALKHPFFASLQPAVRSKENTTPITSSRNVRTPCSPSKSIVTPMTVAQRRQLFLQACAGKTVR